MKKWLFLFVLFLFSGFASHSLSLQQEIDLESHIKQLYLYPDSAMIVRHGVAELNEGHYRVIVDDMMEVFDEKTVTVALDKSSDEIARIMSVSIETVFLEEEPAERIRQLQDEINLLKNEMRRISSEKSSWNDKKEFLDSIIYFFRDGNMNNKESAQIPSTEQLEEVYIFLDEKLQKVYSQVLAFDFQSEAYQEKIDLLQRQLQQITEGKRDIQREIIIDLEVFDKNRIEFLLSYQLDQGISWRPVYDVRVNLMANSIDLFTYALIKQTTGVDWEDINLSLSTARPTISGDLPPVEPWFLRPYQADQGLGMTMEAPLFSMKEADDAAVDRLREPDSLIPVEHQGTSVTFHIPHQVSLASGSSQEKILLAEDELEVQLNYQTYPRLSPFVYFNASIENHLDVPLLPGQANIFLNGGFTGNSAIDYIPPGEDFQISLGIAENIKVKRELLKKFTDKTLISTIPSSKVLTEYEYKITVENYQDTESLCHLFENLPVSEDDRIQVNIKQVSKEPKEKDWDNKSGVWMWEFLLEPQEKVEIDMIYSISHPRDMKILDLP